MEFQIICNSKRVPCIFLLFIPFLLYFILFCFYDAFICVITVETRLDKITEDGGVFYEIINKKIFVIIMTGSSSFYEHNIFLPMKRWT